MWAAEYRANELNRYRSASQVSQDEQFGFSAQPNGNQLPSGFEAPPMQAEAPPMQAEATIRFSEPKGSWGVWKKASPYENIETYAHQFELGIVVDCNAKPCAINIKGNFANISRFLTSIFAAYRNTYLMTIGDVEVKSPQILIEELTKIIPEVFRSTVNDLYNSFNAIQKRQIITPLDAQVIKLRIARSMAEKQDRLSQANPGKIVIARMNKSSDGAWALYLCENATCNYEQDFIGQIAFFNAFSLQKTDFGM